MFQRPTAAQLREALRTSHDCGGEHCVHADAAMACTTEVTEYVHNLIADAKQQGVPLGPTLFFAGLHVGYRLRELMLQEPPTPMVSKMVN